MGLVARLARGYSRRARRRRAILFNELFRPTADDLILDLGSEDGSHIAQVLPFRTNIVIADISADMLKRGAERYGFQTLGLVEGGQIPVPDAYFDIVFCSSVLEHVTVDKSELQSYRTNAAFRRAARARQRFFANEIRRVGKRYFVQTPYRYFPIESHTWLPTIIIVLPRRLQLRLITLLNRSWPKTTCADWHLLTIDEMCKLFPDAEIVKERSFGLAKSLMAVKR